MEESILKTCDKATLKNMALDKGLTSAGFNGRNVSRMRKQDFIDFILNTQRTLPNREFYNDLEDVVNIFQELILDDILPVWLIGALNGQRILENNNNVEKEPERVPNEEDEIVPNLTIKDLILSHELDCQLCQKNQDIIKENLMVTTNLQNLESKLSCIVCKINLRNMIFSPCQHLATCISCSKNPLLGQKCPLCRKTFTHSNRVFF
jgi:hypothetical protein